MSHIKVVIHNPRWRPSVSVDAVKQQVAIFYRYNHNSESTYKISVSAVTDTNCTSTSNVVDNSNGESNDSKPDGEYADDEEIHEEEKTTKTQEYTIMNEAQDKKDTRASIKAQDKNDAQDTDEATDKNDAQTHNDALDTIDAQEVNEAQSAKDNKQESGHTESLRAARAMPSSRALRYGDSKPKHCEYCCPGTGCPKVFYALPQPRDFKPIDDESIFTRRKTKRSYSRLLLKK
ncbi:uncharacterized protein LOC113235247 [Hyposmocoma kahamanoa]|uniref:uncharacterized protein LOC113235247 n=1 Tax=Hyposmocoma kahamanoa TaxID=1477025 RepID=UPI000E6D6304|nr:uncharacterized protein LOC113235247 [Hyposmocoma kahamanoa]XP_026326668.1 uncharacterized protein LOC113235247 [Hyposmocoma kahamanoa]